MHPNTNEPPPVIFSPEAVLQTWIDQQIRWARNFTTQSVDAFMEMARNRAAAWSQVQQPEPPVPFTIEAKFSNANGYPTVAFVKSSIPATTFDPDSILPIFGPADLGVLEPGAPVGAQIPDNVDHPVKGRFQRTSFDKFEGGAIWTAKSGRRFIKFRGGFAGMEHYWLELKP